MREGEVDYNIVSTFRDPRLTQPEVAQQPDHYEVSIRKVENGFIVSVGCKTFVESSWEAVCEGLGLYWKNPKEAKRKYTKAV